MKKPFWIVGVAFVVSLSVLLIQNFFWVGQTCALDPATAVCEQRSLMRSFYLELESCKAGMEKKAVPFSCSKGPAIEKMGSRLSSVDTKYISVTDQLEKRKSLLTATSQPVVLIFLAFI